MNFKKFTEIENHYREKYIEILREYGYDKVSWHASEKLDGANFSFITDGLEVQAASRNNIVDGTFYNCQVVIDKYTDAVLMLKNTYFEDAEQIQVYGELIGPGVQSKIYYGEKKDFVGFEIQVDGEVVDAVLSTSYLAMFNIPTAPFMGIFDSLDEALTLDNTFVSLGYDVLYPEHTGVSQYELGENDAEGIVLKPVFPVRLGNGDRVILKNKNPKFSEKKEKKERSNEPNPWVDIADQYVTENRMNAVLSKEGELTPKDFGRIIKLMNEDVIKDMIKDGDLPEDWKKLDECKLAGKGVSSVVSAFLKENLLPKL